MSVEAVRWAWTLPVMPPITKLVLCALAWKANKDGFAWPTQSTLAEMTGLDERSVRRHIAALEEAGYLGRSHHQRRPDGTFGKTTYQLWITDHHRTAETAGTTGQRVHDHRTQVSAYIDKDNCKDSGSRRISWDHPVDNGPAPSEEEKAEYQARLRGLREQRFK